MLKNQLEKLLGSLDESKMQFGLERAAKLLEYFGNSQDKINIIHIAGSNGKGSVAKLIYELLCNSGFTTGLYTSPHIYEVNERFLLNRRFIKDSALSGLIKEVLRASAKLAVKLTFFEVLTVCCFLYFYRKKADYLVLETGLGGRLDATNIVKKPLLSVITSISLDHTNILGSTIQKIAKEKSAIIKQGSKVVIGRMAPAAKKIIIKKAESESSECYVYGRDFCDIEVKPKILRKKIDMRYRGIAGGEHKLCLQTLSLAQSVNVSMAFAALEVIFGKQITKNQLSAAERFSYRGRLELVTVKNGNVRFDAVFDGAHNPEAVENLLNSIELFFPNRKKIFVINFMKDKDYKSCVNLIKPHAHRICVKTIHYHRALDADFLAGYLKKQMIGKDIVKFDTINERFINCIKSNELVVFCGSFYLLSEIEREMLNGGFKLFRH